MYTLMCIKWMTNKKINKFLKTPKQQQQQQQQKRLSEYLAFN